MPLIKPRPHRVKIVRHICRLKEPNRDALVAYARFIGESVDYVANQLIAITLAKDREFAAWREAQASLAPPARRCPDTEPLSLAVPAEDTD